MPQFSQTPTSPDDLAVNYPGIQALLSQTGGWRGTQNVDALAASHPQFGQLMSMFQPAGGINPQQAANYGPMFALLMGLQGQP